jgi:4-amino-4-deoxy-L-arabinose transferase-like glycosyltransferase
MFEIQKIIVFFKKNFSKKEWVLIFLLILLYFTARLILLEKFPIFTDEGIYINWAKTAWHDASMRFISLTDGKQPLQTWATIPLLKLFPNHPLFAGRLFSVITGFLSLIGIFSLLFYLFSKKAAFVGGLIYIFTPYFLFYDRMALTDSAVNMGFIWVLFFSFLLVKTVRLDVALIYGLIGGVALLTKSSAQLFLLLAGLAPLLIIKDLKKNKTKLINFYILYLITIALSLAIYNIQRLSPYMHYIGIKNTTFLMTKEEFLQAPFSLFWNNFKGVWIDIIFESGFVLPVLAILGFILLLRKNLLLALYFFLWFFIPFFIICSISKVIFPRYLIFFASIFTILAAYFVADLKNKLFWLTSTILVAVNLFFDYRIIFDHKNIIFPPVDRGQYIEGAPAGWGVKEIINYSIKKSQKKPVIILAEGNFGLIADMLNASLPRDGHQVSVKGFWPLDLKDLLDSQPLLEKNFVYVVFPHRKDFPIDWPIRLIKKFDKPGNQSAIYFFELVKK